MSAPTPPGTYVWGHLAEAADSRAREWSAVTTATTGTPLTIVISLRRTISSLAGLCLLPFSTNVGQVTLLCIHLGGERPPTRWSFVRSQELYTPSFSISGNAAVLGTPIPVPVVSTGLFLLVTSIPCSLVARNFRVLSRALEPATTPQSLEKPTDLSFPMVVESTELVTSEKVLGLVPTVTVAHAILG
jgi:hypothetical protein